jgi:hypothetical protein
VPCAAHWAAVLRCVHALAVVPIRDPIAPPPDDPSHPLPSLGAPPDGTDALPPAEATAVRCLLLRAHFGGMTCDVAMLRASAALWTRRFSGQAGPPPALPPGVAPLPADACSAAAADGASAWGRYLDALFASLPPAEHARGIPHASPAEQLAALPPLRARDVHPAAIDFHCSNIITDVLSDAALTDAAMEALHAAGEPIETLKSAMWRFRSGVNTKARLGRGGKAAEAAEEEEEEEGDDALRRAWVGVEALVEAHAARFIRRAFY